MYYDLNSKKNFRRVLIFLLIVCLLLNSCGMITTKELMNTEQIPQKNQIVYYKHFNATVNEKNIKVKFTPYHTCPK